MPSLAVTPSLDKQIVLNGEFIFSEDPSNLYSSRAIKIIKLNQETEVVEKHVGEYVHNFFSTAFSIQGFFFRKYEQSVLETEAKSITYVPDRILRAYNLTRADFYQLGLKRIKNCSNDQIDQFSIHVVKVFKEGDQTDQAISNQVVLLYKAEILDSFEWRTVNRNKVLSSNDYGFGEEDLELGLLDELSEERSKLLSEGKEAPYKGRGLRIANEGEDRRCTMRGSSFRRV